MNSIKPNTGRAVPNLNLKKFKLEFFTSIFIDKSGKAYILFRYYYLIVNLSWLVFFIFR